MRVDLGHARLAQEAQATEFDDVDRRPGEARKLLDQINDEAIRALRTYEDASECGVRRDKPL